MTTEAPKKRGFAAMSQERRSAIASQGGKAVHAQGKGRVFTSEEAREAGAKGGKACAQIPGQMAKIGKMGAASQRERDS